MRLLSSMLKIVPPAKFLHRILQPHHYIPGNGLRLPHADFASPFLGKMYLILIDAHFKWMKVHITSGATSAVIINKMKLTFSTLGLPEVLVTDNGPAFTSQEFASFIKANGIRHLTSVPYHPASNGLAKRAVQTFKAAMKKLSTGSLEDKVMKFLFKYRITPQSTTVSLHLI